MRRKSTLKCELFDTPAPGLNWSELAKWSSPNSRPYHHYISIALSPDGSTKLCKQWPHLVCWWKLQLFCAAHKRAYIAASGYTIKRTKASLDCCLPGKHVLVTFCTKAPKASLSWDCVRAVLFDFCSYSMSIPFYMCFLKSPTQE